MELSDLLNATYHGTIIDITFYNDMQVSGNKWELLELMTISDLKSRVIFIYANGKDRLAVLVRGDK